jgi:hypothetical protein
MRVVCGSNLRPIYFLCKKMFNKRTKKVNKIHKVLIFSKLCAISFHYSPIGFPYIGIYGLIIPLFYMVSGIFWIS